VSPSAAECICPLGLSIGNHQTPNLARLCGKRFPQNRHARGIVRPLPATTVNDLGLSSATRRMPRPGAPCALLSEEAGPRLRQVAVRGSIPEKRQIFTFGPSPRTGPTAFLAEPRIRALQWARGRDESPGPPRSRFDFSARNVQQGAANRWSPRAMLVRWCDRNYVVISKSYVRGRRWRECYLCNTWPKTIRTKAFCDGPLLPVQGPWVMVCARRRGASRSRPVWGFR